MIVIDSSSLILLAKIGLLDVVIMAIKSRLVIPEKVFEEVTKKKELYDSRLIRGRVEESKIKIQPINNLSACNKMMNDFNLGHGEAEAITLCLENKGKLISDDKKSINACRIFGIQVTTAPDILVILYNKKRISKEKALLACNKLKQYGRYSKEFIRIMEDGLK